MQEYDLEIKYLKCKHNKVADALSRAPDYFEPKEQYVGTFSEDFSDLNLDYIHDENLQTIINDVKNSNNLQR